MKILLAASEVVPFAKTGGLADVAGALPVDLAALGHDVRIVMPKYGTIDDAQFNLLPILGDIQVRLGTATYTAEIKRTMIPDTQVPVYFIANQHFFDRDALYTENGRDYADNADRFAFFCKAAIWLLKGLDWVPDIIHCNDWQTALIPVYLRTDPEMRADDGLPWIKVLYTIHNLAYQGVFTKADATRIGIGDDLFHPAALEFYASLNLMKGGILYADQLSTVSRRYAEEIQTPEYGCGLEGVLATRADSLTGILNGIDYQVWNPEKDPLIPAHYNTKNPSGKARCKAELQAEFLLPQSPEIPLIGIISRLDVQKGFDIIGQVLDQLMEEDLQLVLLGTGAPEYHRMFEKAAGKYAGRMAISLKFDNGLAHRIEAGSDLFLMPSRYEPCGLNQLYSLRYGTIPVVRKTGGLADSIVDANAANIKAGKGTGFVFEQYSGEELLACLERALATYHRKSQWKKLMQRAMSQDFSWRASARQYEQLYQKMLS